MATKDEIIAELEAAEKHIATAKQMVNAVSPPDIDSVAVNPGDNIIQMMYDNPDGTVFKVHNDFVQNVGWVEFPKPCTLQSERARLIGVMYAKPDTRFIGMTLDGGDNGTILTVGDGNTLDACVLNGNIGGQQRGILVNARGVRIRNTKILNIARDIDTQAIAGWDRTDDLEVVRCQLEASGENFLLGGDQAQSADRMPRNVLVSGCLLNKRTEWRAGAPTCKNLVELKVGENIEVRDNVMDYSFVDGQIGYAIVLTVRNEYGGAPWSTIKNVTVRDNQINHIAGGFQILGRDDRPGYQSIVMENVLIWGNKITDMSNRWGGNGRQVFISGGPTGLTLDGNSFTCATTPNSALSFDQPEHKCKGLSIVNQELFTEGEYGIIGTSAPGLGKATLDFYAPNYVWDNNKVHKSGVNNINWPKGTIFV